MYHFTNMSYIIETKEILNNGDKATMLLIFIRFLSGLVMHLLTNKTKVVTVRWEETIEIIEYI